jgi:c-Jun-amino-terminal kinase-interacting protein 4
VKVDELTGELEILREELNAVIMSKNKLKAKVGELEDELRKAKEQMKQQSSEHEDDGDVPMAQRKRFTRVEMARVLMERNQYKERFMELQDAVRWTEMMRATKVDQLDKKSKQSIWKFFSNLFTSNDRPQREPPPGLFHRTSSPSSGISGEGRVVSQFPAIGGSSHAAGNSLVLASHDNAQLNEGTSERAMARRREQYRQVRAHVQKEDGRLQAYGWSLPGSTAKSGSSSSSSSKSGVPVPVPVYCRPLAEASPHMKVWCASGVNLNGGYTRDGGCVVGASVFYSRQQTATITDITTPTNEAPSELESLDKQMKMAMDQVDQDLQLSSYVWICTSTHSASTVTVIDAKNPAEVLDSFPICQTHLLCICTVMGALEVDYHMLENSEVSKAGEMLEKPGDPGDADEVGKVEFIRVPPVANDTSTKSDEDGDIEKASEASPDIEQDNNQDDEMNPSSVGPTMWMGAQNGMVYVHSSVGRWRVCLHSVQLPDAVLSIGELQSFFYFKSNN